MMALAGPARRWAWALLITAGMVSSATPALAGTANEPLDAKGWLARFNSAASTGNYQGTMVFIVGGSISSTRVGHYTIGEQRFEMLEALDGRQQRVLRHNDAVHTLWPQARVVVMEKREPLLTWPSTPQVVEPQALEHYEFKREGAGRVAGREAVAFLLEPRDALRYPHRLWADQATGLMLRADVMALTAPAGAQRAVLGTTAFSEVAINVRPQGDSVLQEIRNLRKLDGYKVVRPHHRRTTLEAEGWAVARPVPGFTLAGCMQRGMEASSAGAPGEEVAVLQAVFTDGLTHVSVFIEPFRPQRHRGEMQAQQGATATLMLRRGEHWVTAVGDVPAATLHRIAEALDKRRP